VRVLVVNAGSSSLKLAVVDKGRRTQATVVERWEGAGHLAPVRSFVDSVGAVDAVGHRVVHGGPRYTAPVLVDEETLEYLDSIEHLAPLHNPRSVAGIREVTTLLPDCPAVACFDTAFHAGLPAEARTYGLPREWNARWHLRRYGFHGLSHAYATRRAAQILGRPVDGLRIVSCHLGAGASLAAVRSGRSVDTTMGFTPLSGLVMVTRSGSVDPGLLLWLLENGGVTVPELSDTLEHQSGLKGLSGTSGDLRDVLAARGAGDTDAALAYGVFTHRLRREIGAMTASAQGIDVLVMTGGIGEHAATVRADVVSGLAHLGLALEPGLNESGETDLDISAAAAGVRTVVVEAREDLEVAREAAHVLNGAAGWS
jgi:acetate kinase